MNLFLECPYCKGDGCDRCDELGIKVTNRDGQELLKFMKIMMPKLFPELFSGKKTTKEKVEKEDTPNPYTKERVSEMSRTERENIVRDLGQDPKGMTSIDLEKYILKNGHKTLSTTA